VTPGTGGIARFVEIIPQQIVAFVQSPATDLQCPMHESLAAGAVPLSMPQGWEAKEGATSHALANTRTSRAMKLRFRRLDLMDQT
jgi:hypothetical protein